MNKITFSHELRQQYTDRLLKTYNLTVTDAALEDIVEDFELFLRGCGYEIPDNVSLDFVSNEETESNTVFPDSFFENAGAGTDVTVGGAGNAHSQYYFDTERNK